MIWVEINLAWEEELRRKNDVYEEEMLLVKQYFLKKTSKKGEAYFGGSDKIERVGKRERRVSKGIIQMDSWPWNVQQLIVLNNKKKEK